MSELDFWIGCRNNLKGVNYLVVKKSGEHTDTGSADRKHLKIENNSLKLKREKIPLTKINIKNLWKRVTRHKPQECVLKSTECISLSVFDSALFNCWGVGHILKKEADNKCYEAGHLMDGVITICHGQG